MSMTQAVYDKLFADATLAALLTGGLLHFRDLPAVINMDTLPAVYDTTNAIMKVWGVAKGRPVVPSGGLRDSNSQLNSVRQVVEIYLYDDRNSGWDVIETAADRVYALLEGKTVAGAYKLSLINEVTDLRDNTLGDAPMIRHDYAVKSRKTS